MLERTLKWLTYEKRAGYTYALIRALTDRAEGTLSLLGATAVVETTAGLLGRSLASGDESGDRHGLLTPALLALIVRELARAGEGVFLIHTSGGRPRKLPARTVTRMGQDSSAATRSGCGFPAGERMKRPMNSQFPSAALALVILLPAHGSVAEARQLELAQLSDARVGFLVEHVALLDRYWDPEAVTVHLNAFGAVGRLGSAHCAVASPRMR